MAGTRPDGHNPSPSKSLNERGMNERNVLPFTVNRFITIICQSPLTCQLDSLRLNSPPTTPRLTWKSKETLISQLSLGNLI